MSDGLNLEAGCRTIPMEEVLQAADEVLFLGRATPEHACLLASTVRPMHDAMQQAQRRAEEERERAEESAQSLEEEADEMRGRCRADDLRAGAWKKRACGLAEVTVRLVERLDAWRFCSHAARVDPFGGCPTCGGPPTDDEWRALGESARIALTEARKEAAP